MTPVGKHSGDRAPHQPLPRRRLLTLLVGIAVTLVAWGFLVRAAIDFGTSARGGSSASWAFLVLATIGATACLFLTLILGTKLLATLRGEVAARPVVPGGRRAAR